MSLSFLKSEVENCKTQNQVVKLLKKHKIKIKRDDSKEVGTFSIWLDDFTRIYKPSRGNMKFQVWENVVYKPSGIPTFFATDSYF